MSHCLDRIEKLRGVNLGGWLVLERWITPSLFEGTAAEDEYVFMQHPGAAGRLERHRREFITEDDFRWLGNHGINAVRIPVGYWIVEGDTPFKSGVSYLDWAMSMAEKYGLKVLLDFHATKGSQNGKDHSGRIGNADWYTSHRFRQETIEMLVRLAARYRDSPALWGIELLNEPALDFKKYFTLLWYYREAHKAVSRVVRTGTHIVFSDAFVPYLLSGALWKKRDSPPAMDVHWYQFGRTNLGAYFRRLAKKPRILRRLQRFQPVIVGEWSGMLSHETLKDIPEEQIASLEAQHIERQIAAYDSALGWFYWTYKTEGDGVWNFRAQVEKGNLSIS